VNPASARHTWSVQATASSLGAAGPPHPAASAANATTVQLNLRVLMDPPGAGASSTDTPLTTEAVHPYG
jgi:hypothetical protein